MVVASIRVTAKYLNGLTADTSMASICSVTFIEPNSAPILEPTLPEQISEVTKDAKARTIAIEIREGNHEVAPNSANDGRDCLVKTIPVTNPVKVIKASERHPTS